MRKIRLNLRLFEGEGGGNGAEGSIAAASPTQGVGESGQEGQRSRRAGAWNRRRRRDWSAGAYPGGASGRI